MVRFRRFSWRTRWCLVVFSFFNKYWKPKATYIFLLLLYCVRFVDLRTLVRFTISCFKFSVYTLYGVRTHTHFSSPSLSPRLCRSFVASRIQCIYKIVVHKWVENCAHVPSASDTKSYYWLFLLCCYVHNFVIQFLRFFFVLGEIDRYRIRNAIK